MIVRLASGLSYQKFALATSGKNCSWAKTARGFLLFLRVIVEKTPSRGFTWKYSQYDTYVDFASSMRPWRPKLENCVSYRRRHGAPPVTPRRGNIVQHTIRQGCIVKTIVEKPRHPLDGGGRQGR